MAIREKSAKKGLLHRRIAPTLAPFDEMERLFDDFSRRGWLHPFQWERPREAQMLGPWSENIPKADLIDRENEFVVRAELPGVKKEDVEVNLSSHMVTIKASTRGEEKQEKGEYHCHETTYGDYQRSMELPEVVDESKATAKFSDGVLELTLPKTVAGKRRTVKVE